MKKFAVNFSWGVWNAYFSEKYLPVYDFSGSVSVENGKISGVSAIEYPPDPWGPFVRSRIFRPQSGTEFTSVVRNWFEGIRVEGEAEETAVVRLRTKMGELAVPIAELEKKKLIARPAGERYSMAVLCAQTDESWYLERFPKDESVVLTERLTDLPLRDWFGVRGAVALPGKTLRFSVPLLPLPDGGGEPAASIRLRFLINASPDTEAPARGVAHFLLKVNGRVVWSNSRFSTFHDVSSQYLEEVLIEADASLFAGKSAVLELENRDESLSVLTPLAGVSLTRRRHMEIVSCPSWALVGKAIAVAVWCREPALLDVRWDETQFCESVRADAAADRPYASSIAGLRPIGVNECGCRTAVRGKNLFYFVPKKAAAGARIVFTDRWTGESAEAVIGEIWGVPHEEPEVRIGAEVQTGSPHEYARRIASIAETQLANLIVFRDYHNDPHDDGLLWDAAALCRKNGLFTDSIIMARQDVVTLASGEAALCAGTHEHTGIFYGRDPVENTSRTMKEAAAAAVDKLSQAAELLRSPGCPAAIGDASGGSRYAYLAGFDIIRHETFVGHHLLILPNARGAARAFGKRVWGVHVASQHNAQPELDFGIRRFWLGMYLPWAAGANFLYEEDSLFVCFKYRRMTGGDYLCRQKADVTRSLYRYASTHPRIGEPIVGIAIAQGRYAPPVSGISAANNGDASGGEFQNENYPVWGHTGALKWEWGYRQPEKGLHALESLAPGIFLTPLNQRPEKVRKFFSGVPKGEFDFLPIEAPLPVVSRYQLLLFLDWHTMEPETGDYEKLLAYVRQGGALFLSVPHFTTRSDRDFLSGMEELALYRSGDLRELCGVSILGKSQTEYTEACFSEEWKQAEHLCSRGIRLPNASPEEDGSCMLAETRCEEGVEILISDRASGKPLLTRYRNGNGVVYLLCTYAYPGHEALSPVLNAIVSHLADLHQSDLVRLTSNTPDVYYSVWGSGGQPQKMYVLNTDWVEPGGVQTPEFSFDGMRFSCEAREGSVTELGLSRFGILSVSPADACLLPLVPRQDGDIFELHANGPASLRFHLRPGASLAVDGRSFTGEQGELRLDCRLDRPVQIILSGGIG